jgi:ribose transport system ATP-binding protein
VTDTVGTDCLFEALHVCKQFPGVRALDDVSVGTRAGRLLALLGENGAGKSTLMNICAGVLQPDSGELRLDGRTVRFATPRDASSQGISTIFQELSLAPNLTVAENIFLGREPRTRLGLIDYRTLNERAAALLERMKLPVSPRTPLHRLRVGQQQVVEVARAVSTRARVLIMDEPTSALSHQEVDALLELVGELKRDGVAILYITHKLDELEGICDDVAIMRDGRRVAEARFTDVSRREIVRHMVGREASDDRVGKPRRATGAPRLAVDRLSLRHASRRDDYIVRDVSLRVDAGEVVGVFGLMGAGRTELLETLFGAHASRTEGSVSVDGQAVACRSPADAIAAGVVLAPEDRKQDGLLLDMGSRQNAGLPSLADCTRFGLLSRGLETRKVRPWLERIRLRAASLEQPVGQLSGGNQQKVVLAKWLATQPKVLLLDEPTRGIDIGARSEIYELIDELAGTGLAVLLVSSDLPEVMSLSDRIVVMCEGRKTGEFSREDATADALMHAALPASATETAA